MEGLLFLAFMIGVPMLVIGTIQGSIYYFCGPRVLWWLSAIIALLCLVYLITEQFAEPLYGNKSGLIAIGDAALGILLLENLVVLSVPLIRRFQAQDREATAIWATYQAKNLGKTK